MPDYFTALLAALSLSPANRNISPSNKDTHALDLPPHTLNVSLAGLQAESNTSGPLSPLDDPNSPTCYVEPYSMTFADIAPPTFDPLAVNIMRYRRQYGVNLGSWFVHEKWMTPSLFKCAAEPKISELDIALGWDSQASARSLLEKHWDSFITPSDFEYLAGIGINTVRLPIGYWNLGPEFCAGTPFETVADVYTNSWKRVVQSISEAGHMGLGVLLDLHGAPGSQNGQDHSGISDKQVLLFNSEEYQQKAIAALCFMAKEAEPFKNVIGIQILNEPKSGPSLDAFYSRAKEAVNKVSQLPLYMHDGFDMEHFAGFNSNPSSFTVHDYHSYFVFTNQDSKESASDHTQDVSTSIADRIADASGKQHGNMVIGEWSCALTPESLKNEPDPDDAQKKFCTGQMETYDQKVAGWMFWSYNKEDCDPAWCLKAARGKYLPTEFHAYRKPASMNLGDVRARLASLSPDTTLLVKRHDDGRMRFAIQTSPSHALSDFSEKIRRRKAHRRASSTQTPAYRQGKKDGRATAVAFATHLAKLGFVQQYIQDKYGVERRGSGSEDEYDAGFRIGLKEGEYDVEVALLTLSERVLVSFQAQPTLLASEYWTQILASINSQLPLRNLHWKSSSRPIKTIQELFVHVVHLDAVQDEHASQVPTTLLERPLLNIYVVACEDTDFDTYKNTTKKQIKDWHSIVSTKKHQEWLILQVIRPDARTPSGNFFQMKYSVFERIKTDFNSEKRDRCIQLTWSPQNDTNPAVWVDLINKMKDGLLLAFESAVSQREDDLRRSESQRQMPGWNFCTFFILKESLAASFEGLNLCEDAYNQYNELEDSFRAVLKEKNASWFGVLIQPGPKDDSLPLLSTDKKPYRDLILANTISVFDLRCYILARQCNLLRKLGRINDVGRKVVSFLSTFGRLLHGVETLPKLFVASWIYSSCMSTVDQCDSWASNHPPEGSALNQFYASKGELLELALTQLEAIGVSTGNLPHEVPFVAMDALPANPVTDTLQTGISNAELLSAIRNREQFDRTFVDVTNRAIDMYAKAGRRKFALKLHGRLAAIDLYNGRLEAARTTFASLPSHYAPHMWSALEAYMLCRALHVYSKSSPSLGRDWVSLVLSFLKLCIDETGTTLVSWNADSQDMVSDLMSSLSNAASHLDPDLVYPDHPGVEIKASGVAKPSGAMDGSYLDVVVSNKFPCSIPSCEVTVTIAGRESENYRFSAKVDAIAPGKSSLSLFSPSSYPGMYLLESTELRISGLLMQWPHKKANAKLMKGNQTDDALVPIRISSDDEALNIHLTQPRLAKLGEPPQLLFILATGRNDLVEVKIKLMGAGPVSLRCQETTTGVDYPLQLSDNTITITNVPKQSKVDLTIPFTATMASETIRVTIFVDYTTTSEPDLVRTMQMTKSLTTPLPLVINVQDFFRGDRYSPLFIIRDAGESSAIVKASPPTFGVTTITPTQPAHYLFHLDLNARNVPETLQLTVSYRILREEVELLVEQAVQEVLGELGSSEEAEWDQHALKAQVVASLSHSSSWVGKYCIAGQLHVPTREGFIPGSTYQAIVSALSSRSFDLSSPIHWRELVIPVDVPRMNIIASVEISFSDEETRKRPPLYAGQPVPTALIIKTKFGRGFVSSPSCYILRYDIEEMTSDWLLSGQKRGEFEAHDDSSFTTSVTLIALHHGELELPKVNLQALPLQGRGLHASAPSMDVHQVHGAEKVLVLPRGGRSTFVVEMGN
ncbi:hypothetical protein ONZ45_g562 [Pleurotus djamor]|nr:hypothetical protein ONZ45_g562 [Pleurotus djamor]